MKQISIQQIVEQAPNKLGLEVISGNDLLDSNKINSTKIQKLGLAFAGYNNYINLGQIQLIGQSEFSYLSQLDVKAKSRAIENLDLSKICCVLVASNLDLPTRLIERFKLGNVTVLRTSSASSIAISSLTRFLQSKLALTKTLHGVLLGMYNLGVLILGESGIGKSECALDLICDGHSLISDDSVIIKKIEDKLEGSSPKLTSGHLEIRGLGIINVLDLYGVSAVGQKTNIGLCIELMKWDKVENKDRLGITVQKEQIFDINVPKFVLPVSSGRNISTLVETAVRLHLSKLTGKNAAQSLIEKHNLALGNG